MMIEDISVRNYRPEDLEALVNLVNEADAVDGLERATTLETLEHEMNWPNYDAAADCFLAWHNGDLLGYGDFFLRNANGHGESIFYTWGIVHPRWRRQGLGRTLLEALYQRATERLAEVKHGPVYFQGSGRESERDRKALFEGFGMQRVRYFVNMARPINNGLPPVEMPPGFRLRRFDPARDVESVWQVDVQAFQDHWGFSGFPLEEFQHWLEQPHFQPELWLLAEEEATGQLAGIALNKVDPDWIAQTGRQEGYVNTLAVLRAYRRRGLGTALLAQSLHSLRQAGMDSVHLGADAENLTGAVRIYERLGFHVRKTSVAYRKQMRVA
jgi:mycothiol synthase